MKNLLPLGLFCFFMAIITLILPYSVEGVEGRGELLLIPGYMHDFGLFQFVIYIIIIAISSFKQNLATAAISLIFCFAFFLYFILLSTTILLEVQKTIELGLGFYLAVGVSALFWFLHVVNIIMIIEKDKKRLNEKSTDIY